MPYGQSLRFAILPRGQRAEVALASFRRRNAAGANRINGTLVSPVLAYNSRVRLESEKSGFTEKWDRFYSRYAGAYDWAVRYLPLWKTWLKKAIPEIKGPKVLEVSFGTGYLMSGYADKFDTYGLDFNAKMVTTAADNLKENGLSAHLAQGDVEHLPYADESFDTVVDTMAFSGYPDDEKALTEIMRVLKHDGKLVLIDFDHPNDRNWLGTAVIKGWEAAGDIIHDLKGMFDSRGLEYSDRSIGGFGSVHLYVVRKPAP